MKPLLYAASILSLVAVAGLAAQGGDSPPAAVQGSKTSLMHGMPGGYESGPVLDGQTGHSSTVAQKPNGKTRTYAFVPTLMRADDNG